MGLITAASPLLIAAQEFEYQYHKTENIPPAATVVPSEVQRNFAPVLIPEEMPHPGGLYESRRKESSRESGPRKLKLKKAAGRNALGVAVLDTLAGNPFSGSVPNDDSFALNRQGQMVSVRNSTIGAYQVSNDSVLFQSTLFLFYRPFPLLPGSKYDPRAIYDPLADRFIVIYLSGTTWENSKIIAAFSRSNNPLDGFNIYQLEGNPLNDSTWSDYPHISISEDDLFITVNTFFNGSRNNSGYWQSTIRQINKQAGYDSLPLTQHYYANLRYGGKPLFNFTGMTGGRDLLPAPFYAISNRNLDSINDSIFVAVIDDRATGNPQLSLQVYTTENPYGLPPEARQANNHKFDCNDSRIQGGFVQNNRIQFVGNTVTSQGNSGIYHGMIDLADPDRNGIYFKILGFDPVDIGYPQITYTGKSFSENEAIITFNHSGDSLNAGFSAVFFDNDSTYGPRQQIIEGGDYVDIIADINGNRLYERWGDYTGAQPVYGDTGVIWASGYEASSRGQPLTAHVKLRSPNYANPPIIDLPESAPPQNAAALYPNPSRQWFALELEREAEGTLRFVLRSLDGRKSFFSIEEWAYPGKNTFYFQTTPLSAGTYLLEVQDAGGQTIATERVVVQR